jgi:hypothetical protein
MTKDGKILQRFPRFKAGKRGKVIKFFYFVRSSLKMLPLNENALFQEAMEYKTAESVMVNDKSICHSIKSKKNSCSFALTFIKTC